MFGMQGFPFSAFQRLGSLFKQVKTSKGSGQQSASNQGPQTTNTGPLLTQEQQAKVGQFISELVGKKKED